MVINRSLYSAPTALLKALLLNVKILLISSGVDAFPRGKTPPISFK